MQVEVRKCFCEVSACARKIFVERLMPFVDSFGRVGKGALHSFANKPLSVLLTKDAR